jgi:hypothetical protein
MTTEISDEENEHRFNVAMEIIKSMKPAKFMEWWSVENTGFTENSWFDISTSRGNPTRFDSKEKAIAYINGAKKRQVEGQRWRYVHVTLEREVNKSVRTEIWTEI